MVGLLVQDVQAEALLGIAFAEFGAEPAGLLGEFLRQRRDALGDLLRVGFLRGDGAQVLHVLVERVWAGHGKFSSGAGCRNKTILPRPRRGDNLANY